MLSLFSRLLHRKARTGRMVIVNQHDIANSRRKQNQLSPLTPERVKQLYELYRDGKYADPMLAWEALEEFDETLATVVDRRQSALGEMQWSIATDAQAIGDDSALAALAEEQQEYLAAHFRRVANLTEAVKWLGMASFRKFAHLEVVKQGRDILWLPINQWLLFRPLHEGKWYYNQDVQNSPARGEELDESRLIVREVARPIDLPCMYLIVSKMHAITQWDGFLDVFGIPSMFIEMPQGTNEELRQEFVDVVNSVIGDGRGVLPAGAAVKTVETTASGGDTFTSRADWCDKGIVRRGTGGQLTVLTEAGSGTLAGNAQQETFRMLAAADAADIASCINRQYTRSVLEKQFPNQPHLAYWTLDYANEDEQKQKTDAIVQLAAAGWRAKDETVSEIVGFEVVSAQEKPVVLESTEHQSMGNENIVTNNGGMSPWSRMAYATAGWLPSEEDDDENLPTQNAFTPAELAGLKEAISGGLNEAAIAADAAVLEDAMQTAIGKPEEEEASLVANAKDCNRHNHQNGCSCKEGDADAQPAKLPRPAEAPEPAGGGEEAEEDPYAEERPRKAAPVIIPKAPAPAPPAPPKSLPRQAGETALKWMSGITLPAKYARRAYERKYGPITNSSNTIVTNSGPGGENCQAKSIESCKCSGGYTHPELRKKTSVYDSKQVRQKLSAYMTEQKHIVAAARAKLPSSVHTPIPGVEEVQIYGSTVKEMLKHGAVKSSLINGVEATVHVEAVMRTDELVPKSRLVLDYPARKDNDRAEHVFVLYSDFTARDGLPYRARYTVHQMKEGQGPPKLYFMDCERGGQKN